jgi:hypothetical protein
LCQKPRRRTKKGTSLLCFNSFCRQPFFHKESPTNNNNSNAPTGKGNVIIIWFVTWPTYGRLWKSWKEHFCKSHTGLMIGHCEGFKTNIVLKCVGWFRSPNRMLMVIWMISLGWLHEYRFTIIQKGEAVVIIFSSPKNNFVGTRTRCTSQPIQQAQIQCPNKCPIFLDLSINFFQKSQPPPTTQR